MAKKIDQSVLNDFIVTTTNHPDFDDNKIFELFPEFENRTDLLDAAFSYKATKAEKGYDEPTLKGKFPEFFGEQQETNPKVKANPAPTDSVGNVASLDKQWEGEPKYNITTDEKKEHITPPEGWDKDLKAPKLEIPTFGNDVTRQDQTRIQDYETRVPEEVKAHNQMVSRKMEERKPENERMWAQDKPMIDEIYQQAEQDANAAFVREAEKYSRIPFDANGGEISRAMNIQRAANEKRDPSKLIDAFNARLDERLKERYPQLKNTEPSDDKELAFQLGKAPEDYSLYKDYVMQQLQRYFADVNMPKSQLDYFARKVIQGNIIGQLYEMGTKPLAQRQYEAQGLQQYDDTHDTGGLDVAAEITNVALDLPLMWATGGLGGAAERGLTRLTTRQLARQLERRGMRDAEQMAARIMAQNAWYRAGMSAVREGTMFSTLNTINAIGSDLFQEGKLTSRVPIAGVEGFITGAAMGGVRVPNNKFTSYLQDQYGRRTGTLVGAANSLAARTNIMVGGQALGAVMNGEDMDKFDWGNAYLHAGLMNMGFDFLGAGKMYIHNRFGMKDKYGNPIIHTRQDAVKMLIQQLQSAPQAYIFSKEDIEKLNRAGVEGKDVREIVDNILNSQPQDIANSFEFNPENMRDVSRRTSEGFDTREIQNRLEQIFTNPDIDTEIKGKLYQIFTGQPLMAYALNTDAQVQQEDGKYIVRTYDNAGMTYRTRTFDNLDDAEKYRQRQVVETRPRLLNWCENIAATSFRVLAQKQMTDEAVRQLAQEFNMPEVEVRQLLKTALDGTMQGKPTEQTQAIANRYAELMEDIENAIVSGKVVIGKQPTVDANGNPISGEKNYVLNQEDIVEAYNELLKGERKKGFRTLFTKTFAKDRGLSEEQVNKILDSKYSSLNDAERQIYDDYVQELQKRISPKVDNAEWANAEDYREPSALNGRIPSKQSEAQPSEPLSPVAQERERVTNEVSQEVNSNAHNNGYIYPVADPNDAERTGYIVGDVVPVIGESHDGKPIITNDDVVTVKWSDGTITQTNARYLNLSGAPTLATDAVNAEVEKQMMEYTAQRVVNGETPIILQDVNGNSDGFFQTEDPNVLEDENGNRYTLDQLTQDGWKAVETTEDEQVRLVPIEQLREILNNDKRQGPPPPPAAPVLVKQEKEEEKPNIQVIDSQEPQEPDFDAMSAADYAAAAVEYMGSREYVDEFLDGEIKKVQQQLGVANRKKVGATTGMADFKAKKDAIKKEKQDLQARLDKLNQAREKAKSYLTIAEREARAQAEAERQAAAEAARIAAEQRAAEEAARLEQERIDRELKKGVPDFSEDNDKDARARGFHVQNGYVIHRQDPLQPLATGKQVTVQFAKGENGAAEAHHVLIPVTMAQPSHINGQRNPAFFISEAQPKDRRDQVNKVTSDMMAQNIHPDEIVEGATAYVGAPVLNARGEAVQGNNRLDALIKMYQSHPESVAKYKQYLIDNAAALGYSEADIETIRNNDVIDVRMLDNVTDEQAIQLGQKKATDLETGGVQLIDPQVTATQLGDKIQRFADTLLKSDDEEASLADLTLRNGKPALEFLQRLNIISPAQMQSAFDGRGNLTAETKAALQDILKQILFRGAKNDNIAVLFNDIPLTAQKAILQTIVRDLKTPQDARLVPVIQEAVEALYNALHQSEEVKNGRSEEEIKAAMASWAAQMQFSNDFEGENFVPSEKFSNFARDLAALFKYGKQTEIAKKLNSYYDAVQGTVDMFGETPAIPMTDAVKKLFNIDYEPERTMGTVVADRSQAGNAGAGEQPAVNTDGKPSTEGEQPAVVGRGDNSVGTGNGSTAGGNGYTGNVAKRSIEDRIENMQLVGAYLTSIQSKETRGVLFDNDNALDLFRELNFDEELIKELEEAQKEGGDAAISGFYLNGTVFINVDGVPTPEIARSRYVHERQHGFTRKDPRWMNQVMKVADEKELTPILRKLNGGAKFYDNKPHIVKADEFISHAMEIAYDVSNNAELEAMLKEAGAKDELINIIKSINDEQRQSDDLSRARRTPFIDDGNGGDSRQNGGDRRTQQERGLEPEGTRPVESSERGTEGKQVIEQPQTINRGSSNDPSRNLTDAADVETGGALVDQLERMGVEVSTDLAANQEALNKAKKDKSEAGAIHYYKTQSGQQYGFSYKGKVYLDPRKVDANLPLHEYGHLWCDAFRRLNPEGWQSVIETIKADTDSWNFIKQLRPELKTDDEIADEVIATFSGKRGSEKLKAELQRMADKDPNYQSKWQNIFKNISKAIQDFWKAVGDFLHIKYTSAEQVYDQVLKDFVENMNPRKRIEDFLKERNDAYLRAVEANDSETATAIFNEALRENIGNGITPYVSVGNYQQLKRLAKGVKTRDPKIIQEAAELIRPLIPENAVLIPAPSHTGRATDMLDLANALAAITPAEVADILQSAPRTSQYQQKKETGVPMSSKNLGITLNGVVPEGKVPVVIDNVVDSGNTAEACVQALGKGVVVSLANSAPAYGHAATLKSASPVLRDKNGNVIPLDKRFDVDSSRYLGKIAPQDVRFAINGTGLVKLDGKTLVGLHNVNEYKLRQIMKAGGLANPSAAVIDLARQDHTDYGDISLVLPNSMVENADGTYAGDAWTPMYPHVEYRLGKDTIKKIDKLVEGLPDNVAYGIKRGIDDYMAENRRTSGLEYLFLKNKGVDVPMYLEPRRYPDISVKEIDDRIGATEEERNNQNPFEAYERMPQDQLFEFNLWMEKYGKQEDIQRVKDMIARLQSEGKDQAANTLIERYSKPMFFNAFDSVYHRVMRDERDAGSENVGRTLEDADRKIDELGYRDEFDEWLRKTIDDLGYDEVLFSHWTSDGSRRYVPNTVENASRLMNKENQTNYLDRQSVNETKAMLMDKMHTLSEIRKHKDLLEPDPEKVREAYEAVSSDWAQLGIDFRDYTTNEDKTAYGLDDNPFTAIDTALARLQEAMFKRDPIAYLNKEYRYSLPADSEFGTRLKEMMKRIKALPSRYFETKFRRPVYLNEFAAAVVPNDLSQDLRDGLQKSGLTLFDYDPSTAGSRRDATLKATEADGIRFSINGKSQYLGGANTGIRGMQTPVFEGIKPHHLREMADIKDKAIKDGTFMQAPNGKPSRLNERQWLQVRTENFKRWFGDWQNDPQNASKILDENGEPMVVYHGTTKNFTTFDKSTIGRANAGRVGFFFTPDESLATDFTRYKWQNTDSKLKPNAHNIASFLNVRTPLTITARQYVMNILDNTDMTGYDGIIITPFDEGDKRAWDSLFGGKKSGSKEFDNNQYAALSPNQIKSATENDGSFSEASDDIRFSISNRNNDIFYSNAERAVEGIKQDKATPEQWRAMIEKNGGLKAGEDKWLGLSDWLAQQRPKVELQPNETRSQFIARLGEATKRFTISKQDILDYIRNNKIQIEETEYADLTDNAEFKRLESEFSEVCWDIDDIFTQRWLEANNEVEKFYDEMRDKYGDNYLDELSSDEQRVENYLLDAREVYNKENPDYDDAFAEMVRRYGDDFEVAFWHDGARLFTNDNAATTYFAGENPINSTRMQYTTTGLQNKREIALTVPTIESWNEGDEIHFGDADEGRAVCWVRFGDTENTLVDGRDTYAKVLVIDEIQSKRHQEGREKGYEERIERPGLHIGEYVPASQNSSIAFAEVADKNGIFYGQIEKVVDKFRPIGSNGRYITYYDYNTEAEAFEIVKKEAETLPGIPAAPFEKNWHELAMKRILRFAAENGYDKVAWTTGDQQAARYDIGKQLEELSVAYDDETGTYAVFVTDKGQDPAEDSYRLEDGLDDEGLRRTIGKDLYNRVMEDGKKYGWDLPITLEGDDLVIGTDGMKGFYDDMLPRFMQKYGKKWGATVGTVTMPDLEEGYQTMHSVDITDDMRRSVLEGQPMFSIVADRKDNNTMAVRPNENRAQYAKRIIDTIKDMTPRNTDIDDAIRFSIKVNHNSPYLLKKADGSFIDKETGERLGFDFRFMGRGEGGQAHGWGSYFSANDLRDYAGNKRYDFPEELKEKFNPSVLSDGSIRKEVLEDEWFFPKVSRYYGRALPEHPSSFRKWLEDNLELAKSIVDDLEGKSSLSPQEKVILSNKRDDVYEISMIIEAMTGDFDLLTRHHYTVEIPDNDGTNYIEEEKSLDDTEMAILRNELEQEILKLDRERYDRDKNYFGMLGAKMEWAGRENDIVDYIKKGLPDGMIGRDLYHNVAAKLSVYHPYDAEEEASKFLNRIGFTGIHYDGRRDGECYVIFDENDAKITDHIRFSISKNPKPVGHGEFGDIYDQFKGKPNEAVAFLLNKKDGEAVAALHHDEIGDISIVYGNKAGGLEKISKKHPEVLDKLQEIFDGMHVFFRSDNRIKLESDTHFAVVSRDFKGNPRGEWLLTAFEKQNSVPDNTMDTGETLSGKQNDTATLQDTVSDRKGTTNNSNTQISGQENTKNLQNDAEKIGKVATDVWNKYQFDGELETIRDVAEYVEANMPKNEITQQLFDAIDQYRIEEEEDRMLYGERGDLEPFEDAILNEIERLYKNTDGVLIETPDASLQERSDWEKEEDQIRFSIVNSRKKIAELEAGEKIKLYRAMAQIDGKLYPPMSSKDNESGKLRQPIELGRWEQSEERPDLAKEIDGKWYFTLKKDDGKSVDNVAYNPYFHTSRTPLNDQFTSAYNRGNLVIVETEVPASELTSGYKADKAHNAVGEMSWHSGPVSGKLPAVRKVVLTRWDKPVRVVPDAEVAQAIAEMLKGTDAAIPWNVVTPSLLAELDKLGVPITVGSGTGYKGKPRPDNEIRFAITSTSGQNKTRGEVITEALVKQANNNYGIMQSALKKVTQDLKGIRAAMRLQSDYDRKVVDSLLNLYNTLLQENSVWSQYMPDTSRRIATQIVHAIGKQNIREEVNTIMDHMVHAQAKAAQRQWDKLRQTPIDKINISGVVMQGKVALEGQHALKALNDAIESKMELKDLVGYEDKNGEIIPGLIDTLMDMEDKATDESLKLQYKGQWIGYTIAAQHLERVQHLQEERKQLDLELQAARANKALKPAAREQLVDNIKQSMRDNFMEQAEAYMHSTKDLQDYVTTQEGRAKDFIRQQDANRAKIRSYAQRDLEGVSTNPNSMRTKGNVVRSILDAFASPIRDLQSLLRLCGLHAPDGEGYLYNHFMRNWMDGADKERLGIVEASKTLDEKIAELTHGKYKTWEEAARKINDASHNMFTITMLNGVDGQDRPVTEDIPLNAGNALYIYAVNKMNDGRMKLNGMNITEEDVQALVDKVREKFGQEILDVVDWVQREFFSQLRNRYNLTHEALFGAPMDAIENYFPLRINANARQQNKDLGDPDTDASRLLTGTSTGAIKRRTRNSLPLDVRNADFFQEVIRHISQMERWNAFAQWTRDANILFSDINFRNRIKGMNGTIYGKGDALYNYMKDAFKVAVGTYRATGGRIEQGISGVTLNIAKGVTSAKINFRVFTALKQIASFPAFFTYMTDGKFVQSYLRNWMTPHSTMKWAKENLPNFEKRVSKRDMGDMRLMQRSTDWQWTKRILEFSQKYGMFFNVYFDTLTCATGARAVYDSKLADYLRKGYSQEDAVSRARQDAEQSFNTSQQSSEGAFMSPVQADRNIVTAALTVFRTSPIQYTRNFIYHTNNLINKFKRGTKAEQIAFRAEQYKRDGLNDEQATNAAARDYNKSIAKDVIGFVVYGALLNILWRIAGKVPYLLSGDDDEKKNQILKESVTGGALVSPITGLLGGANIEAKLDGNGSISGIFAPELPFTQDVKRAEQYLDNDKYAEFASQALSVLMQSATGFDPQTAADMIMRVVTTLDSEQDLDAAEQALRVSQALLSVPQSQYEQILVDEVIDNRREYRDAVKDYQRYMSVHKAPLTWFMRGEEQDEKTDDSSKKRFDKLIKERKELRK